METLETIEKRSGCRKYIVDKSLEREKLGLILDGGRLAPSAGNLQDRSFIVVKEPEKKALISQACANQSWMQTAPVHIVIVSENKKNRKFFGDIGEKRYTIQDTAFSVQNMLLVATDLGVGSSLVVGFSEDRLKEILKVPDSAQIHAVITLGYPAEETKPSTKYPLERFVFFESYGEKVENLALAFGEYSTLREQYTEKAMNATKKSSIKLFEKIKSFFGKKKEPEMQDHFMEDINQTPKLQMAQTTPIDFEEKLKEMEMKSEIPRDLPKRHPTEHIKHRK